ncbi:HupE/UreJ protein [Algoriphagus boseongensis]|uniref:HupE/UreJ protein n=1 Tax=Algoriphagus boseongensis TaxID=1442587 RepID=A0A4R6T3D9_9BACT|nr:HupE/UreJ family protein [Algoriphagus boseongensis]TDQ15071.1 HupE/UreJ protein [Algoriphagus boseongensis]
MRSSFILGIVFLCMIASQLAWGHEIRPAFLQIQEKSPGKFGVFWKVPRTVDKVLDIQPKFESNFTLNQTQEPRLLEAFMLYSYELQGESSLENSELSIENLKETGIDALVDIRFLDGRHYTFLLQPTSNAVWIPEKSSKLQVAKTYLIFGIEHILLGYDHLLFVLALIMISSAWKKLIKTITAFTLSHSITLSISALGYTALPGAPVETVIALSIVFLALEVLKFQGGKPTLTSEKPWLVAFIFGLLHGFGFAGALSEIGLPSNEIPVALATFNFGVELGQLLFVGVIIGLWKLIQGHVQVKPWQKKVIPYGIGSIAVFWVIERIINI